MSETSTSKIPTLIFGGVISIIVGIASGYGVNWLGEKKAELTYDVTSIQAFPGQERVGIVAVKISNSGSKELENIDAAVRFSDAEVKEILFQGLTPQLISKDKSSVHFQIPFLNATENFSVQILVLPISQVLHTPNVDLRAKGAVGIPLDRSKAEASYKGKELWSLFASAVAAVLALLSAVLIKIRTARLSILETVQAITKSPDGHSGDQRDVFAFVLGFFELSSDANSIRSWPRDLSYWSISDILTDKWIAEGDVRTIRLGISAFGQIIDYAYMAPSSVRIVQLNIARLYLTLNDVPSAKSHLTLAKAEKDKVIAKRIHLHTELLKLDQSEA